MASRWTAPGTSGSAPRAPSASTPRAPLSLNSKADVTVEGLNVTCEARVGIVAKGAATAELSATGQTTVKGAMVLIN